MEKSERHYVIGTAGHIDHGKTALVKQLTGKDTDWLKEEKQRGITIDLGFAFLGENITIIDVPGHEKFVRNMAAGVSTIDLVLLVIAADDGIMPQTREHLDILKLLQIKQGIIILTKTDLVEAEWVELVVEEIKELVKGSFLENAPIFPVSNETGQGVEELRKKISDIIINTEERHDKGIFRLPIDRIFTLKGFGTVAAGTVLSGSVAIDQFVELLPQKNKLRIRGMQIHEQKVKNVKIGDRAAINLAGIEKSTIKRGDVLAQPDFFKPTKFLDAQLYLLESAPRNLKHNGRIRLNIGTNEVIGRVSILDKNEIEPGESAYLQFRLENPIIADVGDRYVVRSYSPVFTIGGGVILNTNPRRHKRFSKEILSQIKILEQGDPGQMIEQILIKNKFKFINPENLAKQATQTIEGVESLIQKLEENGLCFRYVEKEQTFLLHQKYHAELKEIIISTLTEFHQKNPTKRGISKTDLKVLVSVTDDSKLFNVVLNDLKQQAKISIVESRVAIKSHQIQVNENQKKHMQEISSLIFNEGYMTSNSEGISEQILLSRNQVSEIVSILLETGELIRVEDGILFHQKNITKAISKLSDFFKNSQSMTIGDFRKLLDTSRKYAVPLINYFDSLGITTRQGDVRVFNPDYES
jgi:selenocysteine-specific elongation factor